MIGRSPSTLVHFFRRADAGEKLFPEEKRFDDKVVSTANDNDLFDGRNYVVIQTGCRMAICYAGIPPGNTIGNRCSRRGRERPGPRKMSWRR